MHVLENKTNVKNRVTFVGFEVDLRGVTPQGPWVGWSMSKPPTRYDKAIIPHFYVEGAAEAIEYYKKAFGAEELFRVADEQGRIVHAEFTVCGSVVMMGDPLDRRFADPRKLGACTVGLHVFVDDNAALLRRAVACGSEEIYPPTDNHYGASSASLRDPFGQVWVLVSWKEDLSPAEIEALSPSTRLGP